MNTRKIIAVYKKEMIDTLRDRRTLMIMILIPLLLYPALIAFSSQIQTAGQNILERNKSTIALHGESVPLLDSLIKKDTTIDVIPAENPDSYLKQKKISAYVVMLKTENGDSIKLVYDGAVDKSAIALKRLKTIIENFQTKVRIEALKSLGLDGSLMQRYKIEEINVATPSRMGSYVLGMLIPMLLIVTIILGAMYPAIDLTAGEKERGTMETILSIPISKNDLFTGKYLVVCTIAMITASVNLLSMLITFSTGLIQLGTVANHVEFTITPVAMLLLFILMVPLSMLSSAILLTGAAFARSFKDAQNLMTPILMVMVIPAMASATPGIELNESLILVPIVNLSLLFKDVLLNNIDIKSIFLVFVSNVIIALLAIVSASSIFGREETLLGDGKGISLSFQRKNIASSRYPTPGAVLFVFSVVMILLFYIGATVQSISVYKGVALTEWGLILCPPIIFAWYTRLNVKETFNIQMFKPLSFFGSILLCVGAFGIAFSAGIIQSRYFPETKEVGETIKKILDIRESGLSPVIMYLLFALSPAICEELLFRGIILSGLKKYLNPVYTVLITAILFSIAHMNLFRCLPVLILGIAFSFVVLRTGSIFLSMMMHFLNNGFALSLLFFPGIVKYLPWFTETQKELSVKVVIVCLLLIIAGVSIIIHDTRLKRELKRI